MSEWTKQRLDQMIADGVEESLSLDYKRADSLGKTDAKRAEVSKDVSSFANSSGGVLIYGVAEFADESRKHIPQRLDPIQRSEISKEWLDQVIQAIQPRIEGVVIHPVTISEPDNTVCYIVEVPQSHTAHMARDHRYHKRLNFTTAQMEDYEVRDVMNRRTHPKIKASIFINRNAGKPKPEGVILVRLENVGRVLAKHVMAERQVILPAIEQLAAGSLQRLEKFNQAIDAVISPDSIRREFLGHVRLVTVLYGAVKPDPVALEFTGRVALLNAIADAIKAKLNPNPVEISGVLGEIDKLLDESITGVAMPSQTVPLLDLSKIDFKALARRFKESKHKNTDLEVLKAAIRAQLEKLIRLNNTRADFQARFEELIESYNAGSRNIEQLFEELLKLSRSLNDEEQRHVRENMTEEELVILDILTRPAPELSTEERAEVKKVARELLAKLKQLLVLNWRQKSAARSQLKLTIEDVLDSGLPRAFSKEIYNQKCSALFEHFYEKYPERDASAYAA